VPATSFAYRALVHCGILLAPVFSRSRPKLRAGLAGRAGLVGRLAGWAAAHRDSSRPLLWMHAASVGEGLQAEAVLHRLRQAHPDWQIAYTYFSPSAVELAQRQPADVTEYLPWDRARDVLTALQALRPAALVFSKLDLWPELATRAEACGVAVGITAATVSPRARRLRWPAQALLRPGYQAVAAAGAVSEADAARLAELGVPERHIEITGDPRFDSALERVGGIQRDDPLFAWSRSGRTLVAGSTWPEDEDRLLAAFRIVRDTAPDARLILVPHEPTARQLARLDHAAQLQGFEPIRLRGSRGDEPLLVVDQIGILALLYAGAWVAYVGGGYGAAGLHSVLEPAACGVAVLFGPRWQGSPDAGALLARRAAAVVSPQFPDWLDLDSASTHAGKTPLAALWLALLRHPAHVRAAGQRGLEYLEAGVGAAARNAGLVERLMREGSYCGRPTITPS
jgi:3-deoxy-D-manno-octulosonic-acid transferase